MKKPALLALGALLTAIGVALLWALFAEAPAPAEPGDAQPVVTASPRSTRALALQPTRGPRSAPTPSPSAPATSPTPVPTGGHQATIEVEVLGVSGGAYVDLSWESVDAKGHEEILSRQGETGAGNALTFTIRWRGKPRTRVQIRANDERGRRVLLERWVEPGASQRARLELPLTPILEVRKPPSRGLDMQGTVQLYAGGVLVETPGIFAQGGDLGVFSPSTAGRCRVVIRAALFEENGDLAAWIWGEQEVSLEPGVRVLVSPSYVAMARLRVRVLRRDGTPLQAAQVALRCASGPVHECQDEHHAEAFGAEVLGRGGGLGYADHEDEPKGEGKKPAVPDPAPLLASQSAEEWVFLRPGAYEVVASGNDPSLARGIAQIVLKPGARRDLELRLPKGREVELRLPPASAAELDFVIEGPPSASAKLEAGRVLRVRGLLESDSVRVRARRWAGEEVWGELVLLRAGARHDLRLARSGRLALRLRRPDGSKSDLETRVVPETPVGLGRYRISLSDQEEEPPTWFAGDEVGHFGRVTHGLASSIQDASQEGDLYTLQLLPGSHWIEVEAPTGLVRIPVTLSAGQTVRVDQVVK